MRNRVSGPQIFHNPFRIAIGARKVIEEWLKPIGLELKQEKTRIAHSLHKYENEEPGFDFLGFNIRQYEVNTQMKRGYKTLIKPSKKSVKNHYAKIKDVCDRLKTAPTEALISKLNPIIRGWSNYYSAVVSKETFSYLDNLVWRRIWRWCKRRHSNKGNRWVKAKYFKPIGTRNWCLNANGLTLAIHSDTDIIRHVKVKGNNSPDDGQTYYWATRRGKHPETSAQVAKLLKRQKGRCTFCGLHFKPEDLIEVDHLIPRALGGDNKLSNTQVLHRHCHDTKTAQDLKAIATVKKGQVSEEMEDQASQAESSKAGCSLRDYRRGAGCDESRTPGFEDKSGW